MSVVEIDIKKWVLNGDWYNEETGRFSTIGFAHLAYLNGEISHSNLKQVLRRSDEINQVISTSRGDIRRNALRDVFSVVKLD